MSFRGGWHTYSLTYAPFDFATIAKIPSQNTNKQTQNTDMKKAAPKKSPSKSAPSKAPAKAASKAPAKAAAPNKLKKGPGKSDDSGGGNKKLTLAQIWDDADSSNASNLPSEGEHRVRMSLECKINKKGAAVFANYEVMEGDEEGKKIRQMYKLTDETGEKQQGADFLKRDLELLGYEGISGKEFERKLKDISDEERIVIINVSAKGQYTNAYLQGPAEDASVGGDEGGDGGGDGGGSGSDEIEVGDTVTFTDDDGNEVTGEVKSIKKGNAKIEEADGSVWEDVPVADCTKVDADGGSGDDGGGDAYEPEVDDEVTGTNVAGDDITGTVRKVKGEFAFVEDGEGTRHKCNKTDLSKADGDGGGDGGGSQEIEVGDEVTFKDDDDDEIDGKVIKLKGDKATVEDADGDEHTLDVADLTKKE